MREREREREKERERREKREERREKREERREKREERREKREERREKRERARCVINRNSSVERPGKDRGVTSLHGSGTSLIPATSGLICRRFVFRTPLVTPPTRRPGAGRKRVQAAFKRVAKHRRSCLARCNVLRRRTADGGRRTDDDGRLVKRASRVTRCRVRQCERCFRAPDFSNRACLCKHRLPCPLLATRRKHNATIPLSQLTRQAGTQRRARVVINTSLFSRRYARQRVATAIGICRKQEHIVAR